MTENLNDKMCKISSDIEDYDYFINELQRIIEESPPGMQAKFARTISLLQEKKQQLKKLSENENRTSRNNMYKEMFRIVEDDTELMKINKEKFQKLLKLAKIREIESLERQQLRMDKNINSSEEPCEN